MIKRYENKFNIVGEAFKEARESQNLSKAEVCRRLQFYAVNIEPTELQRIETNRLIVKDFVLLALCEVLNIDANSLKEKLIHS